MFFIECPSDWSEYGNNCYKFFMENMNWANAESHCTEQGGHLASVHSDQENEFILGLSSSEQFWIGGNDEEVEGEWVWSDGSDFSYSFWKRGQPNNWESNEGSGDYYYYYLYEDDDNLDYKVDCLLFNEHNNSWNDGGCNVDRHFVCQII